MRILLIVVFSALLFAACSSKQVNPYDEIFSDKSKFVPINTQEIKEIN